MTKDPQAVMGVLQFMTELRRYEENQKD